MWWTIGIIGAIGFVLCILYVRARSLQAMEFARKAIPEQIAHEYFKRRPNGETMDQIKEALYKRYLFAKPVELWMGYFHPIPFGNYRLVEYVKTMPEDALILGEIAYTILCDRGIYSSPREGHVVIDRACEYDAMTRMCSECEGQMFVLEATGRKVDPDLLEMMRQWSALDNEIATANARMEKTLEKALREPERPEMHDKTEGIAPGEGLFGTKWLMSRDEVLQIIPEPNEPPRDYFSHFGKYHGRNASFSYHFNDNRLTEIWICLNKSTEREFHRMHARLSADFGTMPAAGQTEYRQLFSKGSFDGLVIEHSFEDHEHAGLTEMITFRKEVSAQK